LLGKRRQWEFARRISTQISGRHFACQRTDEHDVATARRERLGELLNALNRGQEIGFPQIAKIGRGSGKCFPAHGTTGAVSQQINATPRALDGIIEAIDVVGLCHICRNAQNLCATGFQLLSRGVEWLLPTRNNCQPRAVLCQNVSERSA
jgi:hypothetical protein